MARKDLPSPNAPNFLARVREEIHAFMGRVGDGIDRALTLREMIASGLVTQGSGGGLAPGPATEYEVDLTPPPPPSNLQATTSGNSILVTINPQTYRQGNGPGTVTIYGAKYMAGDALPVFADAAVLDEFPGDVHSFPVDPGALYRIWAKSVSRDGVPSEPAGGTNGVEPVPGLLDDVSIASLTASRIRSGSVTVGQFIQAAGYVPATYGWRINGDGTAEFSQVVVRGTIFASQGAIGGWNIGSNYLQSTTYVLGTSGTRLNSDGTGQIGGITIYSQGLGAGSTAYNTGDGAWLGRDGKLSLRSASGSSLTFDGANVRAQNGDASRVLDLGATGASSVLKVGSALDIKADGSATFAGSLNAAAGTFNGSLTASAIDAVDTINIAGNAVTSTVSVFTAGLQQCTATNTWQVCQTAVLTSSGGQVLLLISGLAVGGTGGDEASYRGPPPALRVRRDDVVLTTTPLGAGYHLATALDSPGAGTFTYTLEHMTSSALGGSTAKQGTSHRGIHLLLTKR